MRKRLLHDLRIYAKLQMLHLRVQLEYEADFLIGVVGVLLTELAGFLLLWALFSNVPTVAGWTLWESVMLYALLIVPRGLVQLLYNGQWYIGQAVNQGDLDRLLIRPVSPAVQVVTLQLTIEGLGSVLLGGYALALAAHELGLAWTAGRLAFLALTLLSSFFLLGAIDVVSNCFAFWSTANTGAFPFMVFSLAEFAKFPLTIYGPAVRLALTAFLPLAFVSYYPACVLLGRPVSPSLLGYCGPLAAGLVTLLAWLVWSRGLARYESAGH